MNWNDKSLKILGLTTTEKAVLKAISTPKNVQDIARLSAVSRTGVNYCLRHLISKGLVTCTGPNRKKVYVRVHSSELIHKLHTVIGAIQISNTEKKGARIKTSKEDEFVIHVGVNEILPAYERIASENKNDRIRAIQHHRSYNELLEKITPKQLVKFNKTIIQNHLIVDGMLNESAYETYKKEIATHPDKYEASVKSLEGRMADYTAFPDSFFNHNAEIWIFKNTTLIINWREEVAIEITNASMTAFLKDMFEFVKKDGRKIDHNQVMRNILKEKNNSK